MPFRLSDAIGGLYRMNREGVRETTQAYVDVKSQVESHVYEDDIDPARANQRYAQVVVGNQKSRELFAQHGMKRDFALDTMLFAAELGSKLDSFPSSYGDQPTSIVRFKQSWDERLAFTVDIPMTRGTGTAFTNRAIEAGGETTSAYAAARLAQTQGAPGRSARDIDAYRGHPRANFLGAATHMPLTQRETQEKHWHKPSTIHSEIDQSPAQVLVQDELGSARGGFKFPKDCGLHYLGILYKDIFKDEEKSWLDERKSTSATAAKDYRKFRHGGYSYGVDGKQEQLPLNAHSPVLTLMPEIQFGVKQLLDMMTSKGWSEVERRDLQICMKNLHENLHVSKQGLAMPPDAKLKWIRDAVFGLIGRLKTSKPVDFEIPGPGFGGDAVKGEAAQDTAFRLLKDASGSVKRAMPFEDPLKLLVAPAMDKIASGFDEKVKAFRAKLDGGAELDREDVISAIVPLARRLVGSDRIRTPEVHIFDASEEVPHDPTMTLAPHQKRALVFSADTCQFHVPRHELADPGRLEDVLSTMVESLVWEEIAQVQAHRYTHIDAEEEVRAKEVSRGGIDPRYYVTYRYEEQYAPLRADIERHLQKNPLSGAALMHLVVGLTRRRSEHLTWEQAQRGDVEHRMNEHPDPQAREDARIIFEANRDARHNTLPVAISRVLRMSADEAGARAARPGQAPAPADGRPA